MENILEVNKDFNFNELYLNNPNPIHGGNFLTKLYFSDRQLPIYLQLPKCKCRNGIITSSTSKKKYIDLLFDNNQNDLLSWFEKLENRCREIIYEKKDLWFQTDIQVDDIEEMFYSSLKSYKSGKYIMLRVYIPHTKNIKKDYCMIYDDNEHLLDLNTNLDNKELIPLIFIEGIKFSSKSFQFEINLPQIMVLNIHEKIQNNCLIKKSNFNLINNLEKNNNTLEKENIKNLENENLEKDNIKNKEIENLNFKEEDIFEVENQEELEVKKKELNQEDNINKLKDTNKKIEVENEIKYLENNRNQNENKIQQLNDKELLPINLDLDLNLDKNEDIITLTQPNEIYLNLYKETLQKALELKESTINKFLEAQEIKRRYNLPKDELLEINNIF